MAHTRPIRRRNLFGLGKRKGGASRGCSTKRSDATIPEALKAAYQAGHATPDTGLFEDWLCKQGLSSRGTPIRRRLKTEYEAGFESKMRRAGPPSSTHSSATHPSVAPPLPAFAQPGVVARHRGVEIIRLAGGEYTISTDRDSRFDSPKEARAVIDHTSRNPQPWTIKKARYAPVTLEWTSDVIGYSQDGTPNYDRIRTPHASLKDAKAHAKERAAATGRYVEVMDPGTHEIRAAYGTKRNPEEEDMPGETLGPKVSPEGEGLIDSEVSVFKGAAADFLGVVPVTTHATLDAAIGYAQALKGGYPDISVVCTDEGDYWVVLDASEVREAEARVIEEAAAGEADGDVDPFEALQSLGMRSNPAGADDEEQADYLQHKLGKLDREGMGNSTDAKYIRAVLKFYSFNNRLPTLRDSQLSGVGRAGAVEFHQNPSLVLVQAAQAAGEHAGRNWTGAAPSTTAMDKAFRSWLNYGYKEARGFDAGSNTIRPDDRAQLRGVFFRGVRQGYGSGPKQNPKGILRGLTPEQQDQVVRHQDRMLFAALEQGFDRKKAQELAETSAARLAATLRKGKRNPQGTADQMYESFHGRAPEEDLIIQTEVHEHEHLAGLGDMVSLKVTTLSGYEAEVEFKEGDAPMLCSSEDGKQLFFEGGDQTLDLKALHMDGQKWERDLMTIGDLTETTYRTQKAFDKFETIDYYHANGEDSGVPPQLIYDARSGLMKVSGGQYEVRPEGIVN